MPIGARHATNFLTNISFCNTRRRAPHPSYDLGANGCGDGRVAGTREGRRAGCIGEVAAGNDTAPGARTHRGLQKAIDHDNSYDGATILEDFRDSEEALLIAPERR
jgi:hypothetical protein